MVQTNPAAPSSKTYALDEINALRLWLDEKVRRAQFTHEQAVNAIQQMEAQGKLWIGPVKDSLGNVRIAQTLAKDFEHWWSARVYFKPGKTGDLVIIKGWPRARETLTGTRYKVDNPKVMEMQIGKPGIRAAAKESARFGLILVVAVDVADFAVRHNFPELLGSLTVDIPSVILASAIGSAAGTLAAGTLVIGSFAFGPLLVAFGVGVVAGYALYKLDQAFGVTEKVSKLYEEGLAKLKEAWDRLGAAADQKFRDFENSRVVRDMAKGVENFFSRLGEGDNANLMLQSLI